MKISPIQLFIFAILLLGYASCTPKVIPPNKIAEKLKMDEVTNFTFLSGKGKMRFEGMGQNFSTSVDIRLAKDSLLWMSVRPALGIEAARILLTKDSVFVIDRMNKAFYAYDYVKLGKEWQIDANFGIIQALYLGNLLPLNAEATPPIKEDDSFFFKQLYKTFIIENTVSRSFNKITKLEIYPSDNPEGLRIDYSDFKKVEGKYLAHSMSMHANLDIKEVKQAVSVDMEQSKIKLLTEDPGFPFSIPDKYERK